MKVIDILKSSKQPFPSLEIVPPQNGMSRQELLSTIGQFMEFRPKYINVTCHRDEFQFIQNQDGSYSKHLVRNRVSPETVCGVIMSEYDVEMVPHIICAGVTSEEIESGLYNLKFLGINNIMALRGDSLLGEKRFIPTPGGISHADELVSRIKEFNAANKVDFCIGVGGYPEKHYEAANIETDIENLKIKVDAGADYIITQMFFDNQYFYRFEDLCRKAGINVPIIPGLKPISNSKQITLLPESFSLNIPAELTEEIRKAGDDKDTIYKLGENWCISQCKDLIAHGVPAIHFYTMGKARNIIEILKACF